MGRTGDTHTLTDGRTETDRTRTSGADSEADPGVGRVGRSLHPNNRYSPQNVQLTLQIFPFPGMPYPRRVGGNDPPRPALCLRDGRWIADRFDLGFSIQAHLRRPEAKISYDPRTSTPHHRCDNESHNPTCARAMARTRARKKTIKMFVRTDSDIPAVYLLFDRVVLRSRKGAFCPRKHRPPVPLTRI